MSLDKQQESQLVALLQKLEPGFLPYDVFVQVARIVPMSIIEFVPLRIKNGEIQVLLLERSKYDDIWPGEVHTPGTVIRATDNTTSRYAAFERILKDEMDGLEVSDPYFVGSLLHKSKRGMEQAQIFWVEVLGEPTTGEFYPVDTLPDIIIESQISFIKQAAGSYETYKGARSS